MESKKIKNDAPEVALYIIEMAECLELSDRGTSMSTQSTGCKSQMGHVEEVIKIGFWLFNRYFFLDKKSIRTDFGYEQFLYGNVNNYFKI